MTKFKYNTPEEIEIIRKYYFDDKLSTVDISKILNCGHCTINRLLIKNGFKLRIKSEIPKKYSINEDYFKEINTIDKAYFLGLLYADGTLNIENNFVGIGLNKSDGYIIEKFIKYTEFTGSTKKLIHKNIKHSDTTYVQIYNGKFYENTVNCGLYQNKSLTLKFPTNNIVPDILISHFIRGYFDGDGCAFVYNDSNRKRISIVGTYEFLFELRKLLIEKFNINETKLSPKGITNNYCYAINKKEDVSLITNFIYENKKDLYLTRKYLKLCQKIIK